MSKRVVAYVAFCQNSDDVYDTSMILLALFMAVLSTQTWKSTVEIVTLIPLETQQSFLFYLSKQLHHFPLIDLKCFIIVSLNGKVSCLARKIKILITHHT